jgi:outer membrane protein assembly factor BamB
MQFETPPSIRCLLVFALLFLSTSTQVQAEDWTHWRGQNRNGVVNEPSGWDGNQWPLVEAWNKSVGEGSTAPLIVDGRLYTMGWSKGRDRVLCLDAKTGAELWSVDYTCPQYGRQSVGDKGIYSGPSSTPEFDAQSGYLYTLSTDGDLQCWNTRERGKKVWSNNLYDQFDVPQRPRVGRSGRRDYGFTSSPLVWEDWLIVEVGAKQGTLVAFDKRTGSKVWTSASKSPAGHNGGPVPMTVEGIPCVAVLNHDGLLVVRLDGEHRGKTIATWDWLTSFANNIASATVDSNHVLITSSYNIHKIAKLEITKSGAKKVWEQKQASKVCSPVVYNGHVYWAWRQVMCLDYETGAVRWQGGRVGDQGSLIATSDGRLIVWANRGDLTLIESAERSPKAYKELAAKKRIGKVDAWPHVVLAQNMIYCRDRNGRLVCLKQGP